MVFAEVDERPLIVHEQLCSRCRNEHLAALTGCANPGCSIHGGPEVVAVTFVRCPSVQAHTHPDPSVLRPALRDQLPLRVDRRGRSSRRRRERCRGPITARRKHVTAALPNCTRDQLIMVRESLSHRLLGPFPQHR